MPDTSSAPCGSATWTGYSRWSAPVSEATPTNASCLQSIPAPRRDCSWWPSGGRVRGYSLTRPTGNRAELVSIAVDPPARRRGVASALLHSTMRRLRRRQVESLSLMVRLTNAAARGFYEKYEFTKVRIVRGYYEDGADGCLMRRTIPVAPARARLR